MSDEITFDGMEDYLDTNTNNNVVISFGGKTGKDVAKNIMAFIDEIRGYKK